MVMATTFLHSNRVACIVLLSLSPGVACAADLRVIDIFTTSSRPVEVHAVAADPTIELNVVEVDTLERFNAGLSERLPDDPTSAQSDVRKRLATLNQDEVAALRHTAMGLSMAAQLGVDRTPAIVFDQQAVLYGVTDLPEALNRYRAWISRRP